MASMESQSRNRVDQRSQKEAERWVVCGVDGSPASLTAVRVGWFLSSLRGQGLAVTHVSRKGSAGAAVAAFSRAQAAVAAARGTHDGDGKIVERLLQVPTEAGLVAESAKPSTELLVVGAPRRRRWAAAVRGGGVRDVVANARCPVVVVPEQLGYREQHLTRAPVIVAAVDGSPESCAAATVAADFARASGGGLLLAHVFHWSTVTGFYSTPDTSARHRNAVETERASRAESLQRMQRVLGPIVATEVRMLEGDPRPRIREVVSAEEARLVAVGSRRQGARAFAILGSVSMSLATTLGVPTLIVGPRAVFDSHSREGPPLEQDPDRWCLPGEWRVSAARTSSG